MLRADELEAAVWDAVTDLLVHPEILSAELAKLREQDSPSRVATETELEMGWKRLSQIPQERERLVDGYVKKIIPDESMRLKMDALQSEEDMLTAKTHDLKEQLAQLELTAQQEQSVLLFAERVSAGLSELTFGERQELMRLLVEDIHCSSDRVVIRTVLPTGEMGNPVPLRSRIRGMFWGLRGHPSNSPVGNPGFLYRPWRGLA